MYRQKSSGKSNAIRDRYHRSRQTDGRETPHRGLFFLFASFAILMTGVSWLGCNKTTILAGVCALVRLISSTVAFHPPAKQRETRLGWVRLAFPRDCPDHPVARIQRQSADQLTLPRCCVFSAPPLPLSLRAQATRSVTSASRICDDSLTRAAYGYDSLYQAPRCTWWKISI